MGGLRKYMPITYWTSVVGTLALIGFPGFSGFFSKDALIEAVHASGTWGSGYAFWCVLLGVFVTALYSFRMLFLVFHGEERIDPHAREHLHETSAVVTGPLIALAIPSVIIGWLTVGPVLFGDFFADSIFVLEEHDVIHELALEFHGPLAFATHAFVNFTSPALYLAAAGALVAWFFYIHRPELPALVQQRLAVLHRILVNKYYFDWFNEQILARAVRNVAGILSVVGDQFVIDGIAVNGSARLVERASGIIRQLQSGYLYHYAFAMIIGLAIMVGWLVLGA